MSQLAIEIMEKGPSEKAKKLRKNGEIPGIIYGEFMKNSIPIKVDNLSLLKLLKYNSKGSIIKLKLNNEVKNCVVKQVQKDNLTGELIHVDFQYVNKNEVIKMKIPVDFEGMENLHIKKLTLETFLAEIEMQGDVEKIPEFIKIDVSQMNFGDKIYASDIALPEGIKLLTSPDILLAVVNA